LWALGSAGVALAVAAALTIVLSFLVAWEGRAQRG
jgi:hypothetical protein